MTINGVQGGIGNMSRGVALYACPGGLEGILTEACPGGVEQHRRLSRGSGAKLVHGAFTSVPGG